MKSMIVRSIASILIGVLLMCYPNQMTVWLVLLIGFLFLAPGIYTIVAYWSMKKNEAYRPVFPIAGLGSALLGLWMIVSPQFFIQVSMYALGVLLVIAAVNQLLRNLYARRFTTVPLAFYLMPILFILAALYVFINPVEVAGLPFYVLGVSMIVYGIVELVHYSWMRTKTPKTGSLQDVETVDAEVVE